MAKSRLPTNMDKSKLLRTRHLQHDTTWLSILYQDSFKQNYQSSKKIIIPTHGIYSRSRHFGFYLFTNLGTFRLPKYFHQATRLSFQVSPTLMIWQGDLIHLTFDNVPRECCSGIKTPNFSELKLRHFTVACKQSHRNETLIKNSESLIFKFLQKNCP